MVKYLYDAWGNYTVVDSTGSVLTSDTHIGNLNPFRYRGYYYDTETELYFLKTRYYDPKVGRFITIDDLQYLDPETINGLNLYAYCGNNPVMNVDMNGNKWWKWLVAGLAVIGAIALTAVTFGVGGAILAGAAIGAVAGGAIAYSTAKNQGATGWGLFGYTLAGIFLGAAIGGGIGAMIGCAAPAIGSFLGSSFTVGGYVTAAGELATVAVTGAQIVKGAIAVGFGILLMKGKGPRLGHNQYEKQMWNEAMRQLDVKDKNLMRRLHDEIQKTKYEYSEKLKDLIKKLQGIMDNWRKSGKL